MPQVLLIGGVNEREPTLIGESQLQDSQGAEYRVGEPGVFVAKGRRNDGTVASVTWRSAYEASFDNGNDFILAHEGNNVHAITMKAGFGGVLAHTFPTGSTAIVGAHYGNRHYVASSVENQRFEQFTSGVSSYPIGMSKSTFVIGSSVTQGTGAVTATIGLEYWTTEYDSTRGIESIFGTTTNTGAFTDKDGVILTVTGTSKNPRADKTRWYRSVDGGGYPDGGLIQETAIGTTQITDTNASTEKYTVPFYGTITVGGLSSDRDEEPPIFDNIFGPFQDSLLGIAVGDWRVLRFTPAGYPDSWPSRYGVPIETRRRDRLVTGVVLPGRIGVFATNSVHVLFRLPRDSDSVFAAGEAQDILTDQRGCMSRRGATTFTPPGAEALAIWVSRDGIWLSNLTSSPVPITDNIDWTGRVDVSKLYLSRLIDDPINRRLVFIHWKKTDTSHSTGVWYLDYQRFTDSGLRILFADHGPIADASTAIYFEDSTLRLISLDSRASNGKIYTEGVQDVDDSQLLDSSGSVKFRVRTKEFMPFGARGQGRLGKATWFHDAGPSKITNRFYFNRRDSNPEEKDITDPTTRNGSTAVLQRSINSVSLELESVGTTSYGVHWLDIEALEAGPLGGQEGA